MLAPSGPNPPSRAMRSPGVTGPHDGVAKSAREDSYGLKRGMISGTIGVVSTFIKTHAFSWASASTFCAHATTTYVTGKKELDGWESPKYILCPRFGVKTWEFRCTFGIKYAAGHHCAVNRSTLGKGKKGGFPKRTSS